MRQVTRVAGRGFSSWRGSLLTFAAAVLLTACATGTPGDAVADMHGLDPARVSEGSLTAHCVREIRKPRNRRADADSPEVTRCVKRHEAMVIDALLKRQETTQLRLDAGQDTVADQLPPPPMLAAVRGAKPWSDIERVTNA